jgi:hypothetical protein
MRRRLVYCSDEPGKDVTMPQQGKKTMCGWTVAAAVLLLSVSACRPLTSDGDAEAISPEEGGGPVAPPVSNPQVTFDGRTYFLNAARDPALPAYLRVACYDTHLLEPPHALLLMRRREVLQAVPIVGRFGYLGDVTGNGVDEIIVMRQPMAQGLNVRPFDPTVRLAFEGDSPPELQSAEPAEADDVELVVYRQGERLEMIYQQRQQARRVTIGGSWQATPAAVESRDYSLASAGGVRRLWADLYGDGRPVWCEIDGKVTTLTTRAGRAYYRLDMELVACWQYDRSEGILKKVPIGRTVFSPTSEAMFLGKLRGVLAEQAQPRPLPADNSAP